MSSNSKYFHTANKHKNPSIYGFIESMSGKTIVLEKVSFGSSQFITLDNVVNADSKEFYLNSYVRVTNNDDGSYSLLNGYKKKDLAHNNLNFNRVNARSFPLDVPNNIYNIAFVGTETGFHDAIGGNKNLDKNRYINLAPECKKIIKLDTSSIVRALREIEDIQQSINLHVLIVAVGGHENESCFNNLRVIYQYNKIQGIAKYAAVGHSNSNNARIETEFSTDKCKKTPSDIGHIILKHLNEIENQTLNKTINSDPIEKLVYQISTPPQQEQVYTTTYKKSSVSNYNRQVKYIVAIALMVIVVVFIAKLNTNTANATTTVAQHEEQPASVEPSPSPTPQQKTKHKVKKNKPKKKQSTSTSTSLINDNSQTSDLNISASEGN